MVEFKNVSKVYDNRIFAVNEVNFSIEQGEFVFLIGPSGSGKTTIIKMLIRDEIPSSGKIIFNDMDITKITRNKVYTLRREIGVIFQDYKLVQEKTAYENVAFAMEAAGKKDKEIRETVPYVLDIVGLSSRMKAFPRQLSGGEQQRVTIARAIANNPKILIADEPTGNLDPASAWDIVQILSKINNWGTTVIMSTHGTDIVNALNKRIIQMDGGKIVRDDSGGTYDESNDNFAAKLLEKTQEEEVTHPKTTFKVKITSKDEGNLLDEPEALEEDGTEPSKKGVLGIFDRLKRKPVTEEVEEIVEDEAEVEQEPESDDGIIGKNEESIVDVIENTESNLDDTVPDILDPIPVPEAKPQTLARKRTPKSEELEPEDEKVHVAGKIKISNKKAKELVSKAKTPISKLKLSKEILKDLKTAGYKYVEEIIEDGPEGLSDNLMIDPEEVVLVSKEIKRFLEEKDNI